MKYTGYEIVEMIRDGKIKDGDKFEFNGMEYEYDSDGMDFFNDDYGTITNNFYLLEFLNASFEKIEDNTIEEIDASKSENPFEETLANKVNEIIRRFNDANS